MPTRFHTNYPLPYFSQFHIISSAKLLGWFGFSKPMFFVWFFKTNLFLAAGSTRVRSLMERGIYVLFRRRMGLNLIMRKYIFLIFEICYINENLKVSPSMKMIQELFHLIKILKINIINKEYFLMEEKSSFAKLNVKFYEKRKLNGR